MNITKQTVKTHHVTNRTIKLNHEDIVDMLRAKGILRAGETVEKVFFAIPGGGDYSNRDMEIDDEDPIHVVTLSYGTIPDDPHPCMAFICQECSEPTPEYLRYQDTMICTGCGSCA